MSKVKVKGNDMNAVQRTKMTCFYDQNNLFNKIRVLIFRVIHGEVGSALRPILLGTSSEPVWQLLHSQDEIVKNIAIV
jgi:hypothetical protein